MAVEIRLPEALTIEERIKCINFADKLIYRDIPYMVVICQPYSMCLTLQQLGYEPFPIELGKRFWLFGPNKNFLPNTLKYMYKLCQLHGWRVLYRGFDANICAGLTFAITGFGTGLYLDHFYPEIGGGELTDDLRKNPVHLNHHQSLRICVRQAIRDTITSTVSSTICRPFVVLTLREITQNEGNSINIFKAFFRIGHDEGPSGYFAGLLPQLISSWAIIWGSYALFYVANRVHYFLKDKDLFQIDFDHDELLIFEAFKTHMYKCLSMVPKVAVLPLQVVSTVMAANRPHIGTLDWKEVYDRLGQVGRWRGLQSFGRVYSGEIRYGMDGKFYAVNHYPF